MVKRAKFDGDAFYAALDGQRPSAPRAPRSSSEESTRRAHSPTGCAACSR